MPLLGSGITIWIGGVFFFGVFGIFVLMMMLITRAGVWLLRQVFGGFVAGPAEPYEIIAASQLRCGFEQCRNLNRRGARFCARCGRPMAVGLDPELRV